MRSIGWRGSIFAVGLVLLAAVATIRDREHASGVPSPTAIPRLRFEKYTLPNGLDVILSEDKRLPMVSVNIWYHVGPANEGEGRTGFAHLFEHMMFQGSAHVPPDTHFRFLEAAGASEVNGTTDFDRTNYFETLPSNQLELALWLESDRMGYLLDKLDAGALANQQDVVRNERRQRVENSPYGMADEAVTQLLFPQGHPYHADVIGSHADIQAAKLDDVKQFFKQYYGPNNASLVIVGDFDREPTRALVDRYFGSLRRSEPVPPITVATPPVTSERRRVVADRIELPRVTMAWITSPYFKPGDADADVAATILGGGRSSRLYKRLVYEEQIAQDVSSYQYSLALGSVFRVEATARPGHTPEELEKAIDEELDRFRAAPPDAAEVDRARNMIETAMIEGLEKQGGFGGVADRLSTYNHYLGTPDFLQQDVQRYQAVGPGSVHAFVTGQLRTDARVVVHAVPGEPVLGPPVPSPPAQAAAEGEGGESINADQPWRAEVPKAAEARTLTLPTPESARLSNGLTLILNRRPALPVVAANLVFRTGADTSPLEMPGLAGFTAAMLDEGTASRDALGIADELARIGASLATGITMDATFVQGASLRRNFERLLDLLADVVLRPSFPAAEVERQRANRLGRLLEQREDPDRLAGEVAARALYGPRHPYGFTELGTGPALRAMKREDMQAFWKQNFVPNNAALVVAGDISMSELTTLAERAFSGWAAGTPARPSFSAPGTSGARVVIADKPGAQQTALLVAGIGAPRSTAEYNDIEVMNTAFGGLFSSRVNMNLREQHGYSYGAFSRFVFRRSSGPFVIAGSVRTDVTAPSVAEIFREVRGMTDKPLGDDELRLSKDALSRSVPASFETSDDAASSFADLYVYDLGLDYYAEYAGRTEAVTAEGALAAAKQYLRPDRMVVVAVGDRSRIESALRRLNLGPVEVWRGSQD